MDNLVKLELFTSNFSLSDAKIWDWQREIQ